MAIQILPGDQYYNRLGTGIGSALQGLGEVAGAGIGAYQQKQKKITAQDIKALDPTITDEESAAIAKMAKNNPQAFNQWYKGRQQQRAVIDYRKSRQGNGMQGSQPQVPTEQGILNSIGGLGGGQQQIPQQQIQQQSTGFDPYEAALMGVVPLSQGLSIQQREQAQRQKADLGERRLQMQQEAPQRKIMTERVAELNKLADSARSRIKSYDLLEKASKSGELFQGKGRRLLSKAGLAEFFDNPTTEAANKVIQDINFASAADTTTAGKMTAALLDRVAQRNPSLLNTERGFKTLIKLKKSADQAAVIENKAREQVIKESGGLWPLDLLERSRKIAKPKLKKLHEKNLAEAEKAFGSTRVRDKVTGKIGRIVNGKFIPEA